LDYSGFDSGFVLFVIVGYLAGSFLGFVEVLVKGKPILPQLVVVLNLIMRH
jgi:hypothetical protein